MANTANYDFMQTLKADIQSKFCVDASRVYITGFSMGGFFTNSVACAHHDWFRGFARHLRGADPAPARPPPPSLPVMIHHGTADAVSWSFHRARRRATSGGCETDATR